ncbi:uncharacterized protein LOC143476379 isoform X2 [Brachyhypopomus gauderio]|uniref:uncharacterized protein LOC143476379 isoform X2 n=1 Tax=Brachyhypopomus gauderio TaxID=698409 RepID=UPI004041DDEC
MADKKCLELSGEGESPGTSTYKSQGCHGGQQGIVTTGKASQEKKVLDVSVSKRTAEPTFRVIFRERSDSVESIQPRQFQREARREAWSASQSHGPRDAQSKRTTEPTFRVTFGERLDSVESIQPRQFQREARREARSASQSHGPRDAQSKRTTEPTFRVTFRERSDSVESIQPRQFQREARTEARLAGQSHGPRDAQRARLPGTADREVAERLSRRPSPAQQPGREARSAGQSHGPRDARCEQDWQRDMRTYVDSVHKHIRENTGADVVMTELPNTEQHPSDLTRRNFQHHRDRLVSLREWKNMNGWHWRRFAHVPAVFPRSSVP